MKTKTPRKTEITPEEAAERAAASEARLAILKKVTSIATAETTTDLGCLLQLTQAYATLKAG